MTPLIVLIFAGVLPLIWFVGTYNGLVRIRNHCAESFANIDTELKRRHNLIPNLVRTVKGYARHEKEVFQTVTEARNQAQQVSRNPEIQEPLENQLVSGLGQLMAVAEGYPDLKADQHFLELQRELVETENRIQHTRRIYNANVRDLNNRVEMFPSSLVAGIAGVRPRSFFEIMDLKVRDVPQA
ncbi:LemA family protein [Kiritimatiellaeota bacterium B1221]|nr:LemA family protein [Kiritimatiellaeota bacterium B1221]